MIFAQSVKFRLINLLITIPLLWMTVVCLCQAQETNKQDSAKGILSKMQESRSQLRNIQCLVEYNDSQSYEAISRSLRYVRNKKVPPHIPTKAITHVIQILENKLAAIKPGPLKIDFRSKKL